MQHLKIICFICSFVTSMFGQKCHVNMSDGIQITCCESETCFCCSTRVLVDFYIMSKSSFFHDFHASCDHTLYIMARVRIRNPVRASHPSRRPEAAETRQLNRS